MAKKKVAKKAKEAVEARKLYTLPDEEMAFRMVKLYFEEVARLGFKRTLDLDAIINAYFYSLARLKRKEQEIKLIKEKVLKEEAELAEESKGDLFPEP
jgi:hypothetical protein